MKTRRKGATLVETAIALAVITISSIAGLSYQYYGARQMRVASVMLSGMRVGQMLLEDWKGKAGADDYDPLQLNMGFVKNPIGSDYNITVDSYKYYIWLAHTDIETDALSGVTLREIMCTVRWKTNPASSSLSASDPTSVFSTYVRMGQD
jgi:hypothetical protein